MNTQIASSLTEAERTRIWSEMAFRDTIINHVLLEKHQVIKLKEDLNNLSEKAFFYKWVAIYLVGKEAVDVCFTLLNDYFDIHKNGQVKAISQLNGQPVAKHNGKKQIFPQSSTVVLEYKVKNNKGLLSKWFGKNESLVIVIDLAKVELIKGTFNDLTICTDQQTIRLSERIEVMSNLIRDQYIDTLK